MGSATKAPIESSLTWETQRPPALNLHESGGILGALFGVFPQALLLVEDGNIRLANAASARLLGFQDSTALIGQPLESFISLSRQFCESVVKSAGPSTCPHPECQKSVRRRSGEEAHVVAQCTHFVSGEHDLLLLMLRESTQFEMQRAYRDDHLRFRTIFEGAGIGIATATLDGRIIESNPALGQMLGYTADELAGFDARELHPGDFERDEHLLRELLEGVRESFQLEKSFRRKDGSYIWGQLTVSLVRDGNHAPAFLIAMVEDTTARKRAEEQLRETEKLEVIGRLAGGVAHDFNNILTGILLYCDLALGELPIDSPTRANIQEVRIAGEQGAALTQQLLQIARKQKPQPRRVDLNQLIASTRNLLRRVIGEQIELIMEPGSDLGVVFADPAQLQQVILNLTLNARDAIAQGGRITIGTRRASMPEHDQAAVLLYVGDNGSGMDAKTKSHLFEPFFTTKKTGHGTGLGLPTVQRIVKEVGGKIAVETEPGRGTRVEVFLPVADMSS